MKLAIDIGNSRLHFGVYEGKSLVKSITLSAKSTQTLSLFHKQYSRYFIKVKHIGISSVVPSITRKWVDYSKKYLNIIPLIINNKSRLPVNIKVKNSSTLGSDRICNAVAGYLYYRKKSNVIICSFGTANTIDVVMKNGDFIGGIIAPGIDTSAKSLNLNTGKLPYLSFVNIDYRNVLVGKNTKEAIFSGLVNYPIFATEGYIREIIKKFKKNFKVIFTGGNGKIIHKMADIPSIYIPNTVLEGINHILDFQTVK